MTSKIKKIIPHRGSRKVPNAVKNSVKRLKRIINPWLIMTFPLPEAVIETGINGVKINEKYYYWWRSVSQANAWLIMPYSDLFTLKHLFLRIYLLLVVAFRINILCAVFSQGWLIDGLFIHLLLFFFKTLVYLYIHSFDMDRPMLAEFPCNM